MVVDDEQDIATVIQKGLELNGFEVDSFSNPGEALSNFMAGTYDLLITDIRMPVMNGFDLYREIRKIDPNLKVAFMTAFEIYESEFRKLFPNIDVKCFITKPIRMSDLIVRVKEGLALSPEMPDGKG